MRKLTKITAVIVLVMMIMNLTACTQKTVDYTGTYIVNDGWGTDENGEYVQMLDEEEMYLVADWYDLDEFTITEDVMIFNGESYHYVLNTDNKNCYSITCRVDGGGNLEFTFYTEDSTMSLSALDYDIWYEKCK